MADSPVHVASGGGSGIGAGVCRQLASAGQTIATDGGVSLRVEPKIFADEQWTRSALAEVVAAREGSDKTSTGTERSAP